MQEHLNSPDAGWIASVLPSWLTAILMKFLPPGLGAGIMIMVDPPKSKRDLFALAFVAYASSYLFGGALFDFLQTTAWFSFLDDAKRAHHTAVDGVIGAFGWFIAGGIAKVLKSFKKNPLKTVKDVRDTIREKPWS